MTHVPQICTKSFFLCSRNRQFAICFVFFSWDATFCCICSSGPTSLWPIHFDFLEVVLGRVLQTLITQFSLEFGSQQGILQREIHVRRTKSSIQCLLYHRAINNNGLFTTLRIRKEILHQMASINNIEMYTKFGRTWLHTVNIAKKLKFCDSIKDS